MSSISLLLPRSARGPEAEACQLHSVGSSFPIFLPNVRHRDCGILLFSVVERDDELSIDAIERHFAPEAFPSKMILDVGTDGVIQFPQETLPDSFKKDSWSVIRYRGLDGRTFKYEEGFETVGEKEIELDAKSDTAVGTWICERAVLGPGLEASSLILLMFRSKEPEDHHRHHRDRRHVRDYAARLQSYFNREPEMLRWIQENPLFIYVALYECFNSFQTILHQFERIYHDAAVNQEKNLYGVFGRCYQLNKGLINMSFCHPDVLMHKAAIKRIKQLNRGDDLYGIGRPLMGPKLELDLRLQDMEMDLEDFEAHLGFISDRFKSAMDMEFNLSGERLNLIMMWFTGFTVLFTPVAFVAAVFALTDSDIVWFLIAGSCVLVISIAICLWAYSSIVNLGHRVKEKELRKLLHKLPYQETHKKSRPSDDPDEHPRRPTSPPPRPPMPTSHSRHDTHRPGSSYIPPPPRRRRGSSSGSYTSSSSFSPPGASYRTRPEHILRTQEQTIRLDRPLISDRHKKPEPSRQRTQSGTMMYSRRRTPMSSSIQRPVIQVPPPPQPKTKPHVPPYPYGSDPSRPANITVVPSGSGHTHGGPPRPPQPTVPPLGPTVIIQDPRPPPQLHQPPSARPPPPAISRSTSHSRRSSTMSDADDPR